MDFALTDDQEALLSAIEKIATAFCSKPTEFHGLALTSATLERELSEGHYFDVASVPEWGAMGAALAVERLARMPYAVEIALSMLVRPHLSGDVPRPIALVEANHIGRFVVGARTVLVRGSGAIGIMHPDARDTEPVAALFGYPMGRLLIPASAIPLSNTDSAAVTQWLQVSLAAEASGLMQAAIATAVDHLTQRRQFGRPLGSFQALRHRMAECAVLAGGVKWLALNAAYTREAGDAALAAFHAQDCATRIAHDVHQMLGAMGMTLEHPLHLWTYRLKALVSMLDGRSGQAAAVARHCFLPGAQDL